MAQVKDQSASLIQQNLNNQLAARRQMLMNPAISGYTEEQLARALDFAFGSSNDLYSTLGGVGIENLGLIGLPGINNEATQNIMQQGDRLLQIGMAIGGPNSLAAQLAQKAQIAQAQENQRYQQAQFQLQQQEILFQQRSKQLQTDMERFTKDMQEKRDSGETITMQDLSMGLGLMQLHSQLNAQYQQTKNVLQQQLQGRSQSSGLLSSIIQGGGYGTNLFGNSMYGSSSSATGFGSSINNNSLTGFGGLF